MSERGEHVCVAAFRESSSGQIPVSVFSSRIKGFKVNRLSCNKPFLLELISVLHYLAFVKSRLSSSPFKSKLFASSSFDNFVSPSLVSDPLLVDFLLKKHQ